MSLALRAKALDVKTLASAADWLAVVVAVSVPWSTTATGILIALWLIVVAPTLSVAAVKRELASAAGGLPVLLCALATLGLLWADAPWSERFGGYTPFVRLLLIPVLLAQFRRSERGMRVIIGFFCSVTGVLVLSWMLVAFPGLPWHASQFGVPAKDYILQSDEFLMCAMVVFAIALDQVQGRRWQSAAGFMTLGVLFIANIVFVATGRTTLLVAPVLVLLLGWRQFRWKGLLGSIVLLAVIGGAATLWSPYLHARLNTSVNELHAYESSGESSSTAVHIELMKKSVQIFRKAWIIGHGTGSIPQQFRNEAIGKSGITSIVGVNPHDQILAIGIQLGLAGVGLLFAMWAAHLLLFRGGNLISWIGVVVVVDNIVSCLFNSHLFDFTQAWLYIFAVGAVGGLALRSMDAPVSSPDYVGNLGWDRVPHGADATSA